MTPAIERWYRHTLTWNINLNDPETHQVQQQIKKIADWTAVQGLGPKMLDEGPELLHTTVISP